MRKKSVFVSLLAVLALTPLIAYGATFGSGKTYNLASNATVNDNLYVAGGEVSVNGTVNGDLLATGGNIMVTGPVSGSVSAVGGSLFLNNNVGGSIRVAGGNINISKPIGGDLLVAGGQVNVIQGSVVAKDVAIAGGSIYIDGTVNGSVRVAGGQIKLGPNAVIKGSLDYYSRNQATIEQGAVVQGDISFHQSKMAEKTPVNKGYIFGVFAFLKTIMIFVAALVLMYFFRNQTDQIVGKSVSKFWGEALRGFIVLVVVPIAVILSFVTILGASLGVIVALFYSVFVAISSIISVLLFAQLSMKYVFKKNDYRLNWWVVAIATLVLGLIAIIPFVGWIAVFLIFISALGSTSDFVYHKLRA